MIAIIIIIIIIIMIMIMMMMILIMIMMTSSAKKLISIRALQKQKNLKSLQTASNFNSN